MKAFAFGVMTGSVFVAGFVALAAPARADIDDPAVTAYAAHYGGAVCQTLDEYPTDAGILGVGQGIMEHGFTAFQAGEVIYLSVDDICPRHMALVRSFAKQGTAV